MAAPVRIANCSGFYGDRLSAAREMVEGGPIDVLTGDWLAELTMLILARTRMKRPDGGYARSFLQQLEEVLATCVERDIKVVANAGGLDPAGCALAVRELAARQGLRVRVAHVEGDDLLPRIGDLVGAGDLRDFTDGRPIGDASRYLTANAYLGCWGIVAALDAGADVVVTGRTTDAAIVCGPAAWHHGWSTDDWDALAGAVVAGHVIECGTQATGGNYSFFTEVPGMARVGFPWAEIAADGSSTIGKHDGTGGEVSIGTVTSQLLYEIGGPDYLGPDVVARFDTVRLEQLGPDRVAIGPVRGTPPPDDLKVSTNVVGGHRNTIAVALTGLDVEAKAQLVEAAFWAACPLGPGDFATCRTRLLRTDHEDPSSNEAATATWRLDVKDPDEAKVGRVLFTTLTELGLATIPGFHGGGTAPQPRPYAVHEAALIRSELVEQRVVLDGELVATVPAGGPASGFEAAPLEPMGQTPSPPATDVPTRRAPLGTLVGARSGDKGGDANLGVFVRRPKAWPWLSSLLTVDTLVELLPELAGLAVERHELPNLLAINFVIRGLLEEGVAASTRTDAQAKSLGEWLRARWVDIPIDFLDG
jgi:hypothetical protein